MKSIPSKIASIATLGLCLSVPGHAQTFNNATGDGLYSTAGNWSGGAVPNLTTATTATIAASATYTGATGDLLIANGGVLEVTTGGTWTQNPGNNYIQLQGGGTVLVDGGTFNQGTASSNPFNINGTGNAFTITAGVANIDTSFNLGVGLTFLLSGGTLNVNTGEFDINNATGTIAGGTLNTGLLTAVNGPAGSSLSFSSGTINLTDSRGIYGSLTNQLNFTAGSSGVVDFENSSLATVEGLISAGVIGYNDGVGTFTVGTGPTAGTDFTLISTSATSTELVSGISGTAAVPEPSTYALMGAGLATLVIALRRRNGKLAL